MPGQFYRSRNELTGFEEGPQLFNPNMRHSALLKRGDTLYVFWTQVGEAPERMLLSTIALAVRSVDRRLPRSTTTTQPGVSHDRTRLTHLSDE